MKKVIFVCLLSLSVCLSKAAEPVASQQAATVTSTIATAVEAKTEHNNTEHTQAGADVKTTPTPVKPETKNGTDTNNTQAVPVSNETTTKNGTKADNSTGPKTDTTTTVKPAVDPPKEKNDATTVAPAVKPNNSTNADNKDGKKTDTTTTPKAETVSPSAAPVEAKSRAFDGPSFIGGIILTLGLLAIGFMGFKYYKNQTERNYHTL